MLDRSILDMVKLYLMLHIKCIPNAVNKLRGTDLDCFYQDEKVDKFLNALENLLLE